MQQGYVYILINPVYKEDCVKIGQTENIDQRLKVLSDKTCLPYPFELYAYCKTSKYQQLERQIHRMLRNVRINQSREFFQIVPSEALKELRILASTIDDAVFSTPLEDTEKRQHPKLPNFRFSMVHLRQGDELIFEPTGTKVTISNHKDDNRVEYDGKQYTLSGFCRTFMPDNKRNAADAYQGASYFSHNGQLLVKLRTEYERAA